MPYTIGASHGPFTGAGSFTIDKPIGIRSILSGIPSHTGHDGGSPRRYFKLGRFTLGNPHGFQFSHGLEYVEQLLYPVAPVWELLAYDIRDSSSCTFYELVDVPDLALKQPWDRTALPVSQFTGSTATDGAAGATMFTYTVPTGRKLWLSSARTNVRCTTASPGARVAQCWLSLGATIVVFSELFGLAVGMESKDELNGAGLILNAGQVLTASRFSTGATGQCDYVASFQGFLFDA